ncbi:MAG: membrane dipeptidase [Tepidisphaeraceae bacterium]
MPIVDAHLDLAYNVGRGRDVTKPAREQPIAENEIATVGFPDLRAGGVGLVFATVFCGPDSPKHRGYRNPQEAYEQALVQFDQYDAWFHVRELTPWTGRVSETDRSVVQALILLEGAEAIRTIEDAQAFYDRGMRVVGLSWQKTRYAGGTSTPGPLTDEGRMLVRELDRLGVLHDASHLAERSFWDLLHATDQRVVASHSNCRSIVGRDPNERHLTDAMIREIVARGGVVGINFFDRFLMPFAEYGKRRCNLEDVVAHVKHICDLAGSDRYVGIGTDMDGGLGREQIPGEIETSEHLSRVGEALRKANFSDEAIDRFMGGNWIRIAQTLAPITIKDSLI